MGYRPRGSMSGLAKASDLINAAEGARIAFMDSVDTHQKRLERSRLMDRQQVEDDRQKVADDRSTILFDQNQKDIGKKIANAEFAKTFRYKGNSRNIHVGAMKTFADKFGKDLANVTAKAKTEAKAKGFAPGSKESSSFIVDKIKKLNPDIIAAAKDSSMKLREDVFNDVRATVLKATGDRNLANLIAADESSGFSSVEGIREAEASRVKRLIGIQKDKRGFNKDVVSRYEKFNLADQRIGKTTGGERLKPIGSFKVKDTTEFMSRVQGNDDRVEDKVNKVRNILRDKHNFTEKDFEFIKQAFINTYYGNNFNVGDTLAIANDAIAIKKDWETRRDGRKKGIDKQNRIKNLVSTKDYQKALHNLVALDNPIIGRSLGEIMSSRVNYDRQTKDISKKVSYAPKRKVPQNYSKPTDKSIPTKGREVDTPTSTKVDREIPKIINTNANRSITDGETTVDARVERDKQRKLIDKIISGETKIDLYNYSNERIDSMLEVLNEGWFKGERIDIKDFALREKLIKVKRSRKYSSSVRKRENLNNNDLPNNVSTENSLEEELVSKLLAGDKSIDLNSLTSNDIDNMIDILKGRMPKHNRRNRKELELLRNLTKIKKSIRRLERESKM